MTQSQSDIRSSETTDPEFAWSWFQYHASQRLTSFNFFLIIVGLLLVGYAQAIDHSWNGFGAALWLLGALVAACFLALDIRNDELVQYGLVALEDIKSSAKLIRENKDRARFKQACGEGRVGVRVHKGIEKRRARGLLVYRVLLRSVISVVGAGFLVAAIWAACGFF